MSARNVLLAGVAALLFATLAQAMEPAPAGTGKQVFDRWCAGCHGRLNDHQKMLAGTYVLGQRYGATKPAALEDRSDLAPEYLRYIVRHGLNVMPASRKTEISDAQLEQLVQYLTVKGK